MKKIILIAFFFINSTLIFPQENHKKCNTTYLVNKELKNNSDYAKARQKELDLSLAIQEKATITIPVVIHVVHRQTHVNIGSGTNI